MGSLCAHSWENWLRYNGTRLYVLSLRLFDIVKYRWKLPISFDVTSLALGLPQCRWGNPLGYHLSPLNMSVHMGQLTKAGLSCYLALLSNDSKTRLQDSRTFLTWPIYIFQHRKYSNFYYKMWSNAICKTYVCYVMNAYYLVLFICTDISQWSIMPRIHKAGPRLNRFTLNPLCIDLSLSAVAGRWVTSDPAELPILPGRKKSCTSAVEENP